MRSRGQFDAIDSGSLIKTARVLKCIKDATGLESGTKCRRPFGRPCSVHRAMHRMFNSFHAISIKLKCYSFKIC